jgi:hypothetical protein
LGFPPHPRQSHPSYDPNPVCAAITIYVVIGPQSSRHHYNLRRHRTPIEPVGDGSGIHTLELGPDGGDLEDLCVVVQQGPKAAMGILNID